MAGILVQNQKLYKKKNNKKRTKKTIQADAKQADWPKYGPGQQRPIRAQVQYSVYIKKAESLVCHKDWSGLVVGARCGVVDGTGSTPVCGVFATIVGNLSLVGRGSGGAY